MNLVTAVQLLLLLGCPNALSIPPATPLLALSPLINYQIELFSELELTIYCKFLSFKFYAKGIINNIFSQKFMKENCVVSILPVRQ